MAINSDTPTTTGLPCQVCGRTDYPHECMQLPTILNSRYYCFDGEPHVPRDRRFRRRPRCERCFEVLPAPGK